ncbi:MAG: hypothetical protein VZR53_20120 [Prevotella sp.]|nr:hypothetical protein [Prevotella sp.]
MNSDWTFITPEEIAAATPAEKEAARQMVLDLIEKVKTVDNALEIGTPEWERIAELRFKLYKLSIDLFEI